MQTSTPKTVWITGASSGIGRACAEVYAKRSYRVILSSRRREALENVAKELSSKNEVERDNLIVLPLDLSKSDGFPSLVSDLIKKVGTIDFVINSGGISQRSLAVDTSLDVDRRIMEIDYFGTVALTKASLPTLFLKNPVIL